MHVCGHCFLRDGEHDPRCYEDDCPHSHWPPLCCPECPCLSYYEAHPDSQLVPPDLRKLGQELQAEREALAARAARAAKLVAGRGHGLSGPQKDALRWLATDRAEGGPPKAPRTWLALERMGLVGGPRGGRKLTDDGRCLALRMGMIQAEG